MVPPTESPYGPMTKDICYDIKMAPNCALGTIVQNTKLLVIRLGQKYREKTLAGKRLFQGTQGTDGSSVACGTPPKQQLTFNDCSKPGHLCSSSDIVLTEMPWDWKKSKWKCKNWNEDVGDCGGGKDEEDNLWTTGPQDDERKQM